MTNLLKKGELYFNTYSYFRTQEANEKKAILKAFIKDVSPPSKFLSPYRRDDLEGLEKTFIGKLSLSIKEKTYHIPKANLNIFQNKQSHLYCMYSIDNRVIKDYLFDKRNLQFGKFAVFIKNPQEFINRINAAFEKHNLTLNYAPVMYYEETNVPTELTPFHKRSNYSFQKEFRITTKINNSEAFKLSIGNIEGFNL